jgi:hypothetical protein
MDRAWKASRNYRQGEHREKSEISDNLPIVDAPEGPHTIRYVSMDWSHPCAQPRRGKSPLARDVIWR